VTDVLREGEGARAVDAIRVALARGEQVFVVYPLIEESEQIDLRAATEMSQRIARRSQRRRSIWCTADSTPPRAAKRWATSSREGRRSSSPRP
jgi:RecG-like helicase